MFTPIEFAMSEPKPVAVMLEDEPQIRRFVRIALESEGWQVFETDNAKRGLIEAGTRKPDLLIVDLGLPDSDGVDFIRELRGWSNVAVIVLSARSDETDKVRALDAGADDYLTKPFGIPELLARVRANLRRLRDPAAANANVFVFGEIRLDRASRTVTRRGAVIHLTPIEYRLLCTLTANAGRVLTHRHLLREVWGPAQVESGHCLRVHMSHLRQKLEDDPAQPRHLLTETAVGYRLVL